jgi:hypothetical protein
LPNWCRSCGNRLYILSTMYLFSIAEGLCHWPRVE